MIEISLSLSLLFNYALFQLYDGGGMGNGEGEYMLFAFVFRIFNYQLST